MDLSGSQKFAAPPQQVWNALMNPAVLKDCIPGATNVTIANNVITIDASVNVPFISGAFQLAANIVEQTPPSHAKLAVDRTGSFGAIKGDVTIDLAADGAGTNLSYSAHLDLSGKVGMADNPLGKPIVNSALGTFFKNLESKV
jgi:uncharacterized protein